ncbi:hypothetical protein [Microbacterium sp. A93]|uniref:hypothetical protein n=1 Tax=Microbacterium sp. A93 TaxID=3450716 RepID=UPI003F42B755
MTTAPDSSTTTPAGGRGAGLRLTSWDVGYFASALVVLAGSLIPLITVRWGVNLWGAYNLFFIGIGVLLPLTAAGFQLARAASGASARDVRDAGPRLGSLSTEQFAHVAAWLALAFYFITFATTLDPVLLIGLAGGLGLVVTSPLRGLVAPLVTGAAGRARSAGSPAARAGSSPGQSSAHTPGRTADIFPTPAPAPDAGEVQDRSGPDADVWDTSAEPDTRGAGDAEFAAGAAGRDDATGTEAEGFPSPAYGQPTTPESPKEFRASAETGDQEDGPADGQPTGAEIDEELGMTRVRPRSTDEAAASATAAFGASAADTTEATDFPQDTGTASETGFTDSTGFAGAAASEPPTPRGTEPAEYEAFWFAVGTRRSAVAPEDGHPVFELEPGGWILALEDRGQEFLVQNTDGRTGVLRDLTDIERA